VNTGFGRLAQTHIPNEQLELLQTNLVLSHAVGVGAPLPAPVVRLTLALKIATLARGYSGVRRELVDALVKLYNADVLPHSVKGSVGATYRARRSRTCKHFVRVGRSRMRRQDHDGG
jgi:histidine ammonia-lyase